MFTDYCVPNYPINKAIFLVPPKGTLDFVEWSTKVRRALVLTRSALTGVAFSSKPYGLLGSRRAGGLASWLGACACR